MKYQIREGQNSIDGSPIFRVYKIDAETAICMGALGTLKEANAYVERARNPKAEVIVAEYDA